jgi:hypothetical protein
VGTVLVECHRLGRVAVDLVATTPDLGVPRLHGMTVGFAVETADQLEREARWLLRGKAENSARMSVAPTTSILPNRRLPFPTRALLPYQTTMQSRAT